MPSFRSYIAPLLLVLVALGCSQRTFPPQNNCSICPFIFPVLNQSVYNGDSLSQVRQVRTELDAQLDRVH